MILDLTHTSDPSFFEALDHFGGPVLASHTNCRALVPHERQFSDEQLKLLLQRGAVIGAAAVERLEAPPVPVRAGGDLVGVGEKQLW